MLIQFFDVQPFIASLAGLFAARGLAFLISLSSIKVEDPAILWLQTKLFYIDGWFLSPTGIIALLVVVAGARSCCSSRGSAARSTRSAATSSPPGSWDFRSCARSCSPM